MVKRTKLYSPDVRVTLYKTITRQTLDGKNAVSQRFQTTNQRIDLTPFLGENSALTTSKSVREPAGGFSIVFADKPYKQDGAFESLYGLLEPMDFIEIRMRHDAPNALTDIASGADPTRPAIVMRGFVSRIDRSETMGADGRPQRSVTVSGQDYGKLWQMLQILYLPEYVIGADILSSFKLFERFGVGFQTSLPAADFVRQTVEKVINPYLQSLMPANSPNPTAIKVDDVTVAHGTMSVTGPQNQQGTIYNLLRTYGDVGVWNELYLEDREDGVYCVYRPNPARSITGDLIQSDAPSLTPIDLLDEDVISLGVSRSDEGVANYYWVRAPRFDLVDTQWQQQFAIQSADRDTVLLDTYPNSAQQYYGMRVMYAETQQGGDDVETFNSGLPAAQQAQRNTSMAGWVADRRKIVVAQNKDNVLLERGTMRVRGNERIKAGSYVRLRRGGFVADYYVTQVDHNYIPFVGFFSTLTVERGMGFVQRLQRDGGADSPYLSELSGTLDG